MTARVVNEEAEPPEEERAECECGSVEPRWHGPCTDLREYCCDGCYVRRHPAARTAKAVSP